jgi:phosphohistidine swiveling domain-containing protein
VFGYGEDAIVGALVAAWALRGGVPAAQAPRVVLALLTAPADVPTDTEAAQHDLLELAALAEGAGLVPSTTTPTGKVGEALRAHVHRYGYLVGDEAAVWGATRAHLGNARQEQARRRAGAAQREAEFQATLASLRLPEEDHHVVVALRRQVGVRTARRELWLRVRAAYGPHLAAMARALALEPQDLHLLTHEELDRGLAEGALPDLAARRQGAALLALDGGLFVLTGPEAARLLGHAASAEPARPAAEVLRGLGASPGRARGRVRVLRGAQDAGKVARGDILVTDMTQPDLVLACERSAAIVTDLGGMLCHAAIVSRELGIPCVLGTGRATSWLRDGDVVEVDGEAGTVTLVVRQPPL